ncbi:carotenoid 9,10(9',10')-cleavage dioxygenase 1-like isoform X1 [Lycium ferocissimum]|uniref:carotenoid 9,10(9',10')-cleavage dioxygenase 1-like isoform X1 n=1 Tax=Lycium ferocissimum TaxID=112874 RepID=UPI002815A481|nr:carotenoid 9,10(9',10')-cleavage dioxygenase 1-like isoform X1 [Lycium ferocissimum]
MAACIYACQVNCRSQKPIIIPKCKNLRASVSSTLKPFLTNLEHFPLIVDVPKVMKETAFKLLDTFVDLTFEFVDQPLSPSQSNFAPVDEIGEAVRVTAMEGKIPNDFPEGVYVRNGSNPLYGGFKSTKSIFGKSSHLWIEGEGMLHALYFTKEKGKGSKWNILYKNKYVQTDTFNMEKNRKKPGFLPNMEGDALAVLMASLLNVLRYGVLHKYQSNTNVFEHSKKYYSIAENHMPQEINIQTLETLGNWTVNGAWSQPFTAHPKKVLGTNELVIMGINPLIKPYLELGVISADGKQMVHKVDLKFNRCILCHEIGVTKRYNVILDFPLTIDISRLIRGEELIKYDKDEYARIGIMLRYGDANSIKWFEVEPCCVFHIINCFEDNDEVVVRACRSRRSILPRPKLTVDEPELSLDGLNETSSSKNNVQLSKELFSFFHVCEWRLNMKTGEVKMKTPTTTEDQFVMEFPIINEHFIGLKNKFGYLQLVDSEAFSNYFAKNSSGGFAKFGGLAKLHFEEREVEISKDDKEEEDLIKVEYHIFPKNTFCTGATFVPKLEGVDEDDGWIVAFTHNENTNESQVYIIDAKKFEREPVAIVILPCRVPYGFHGAFMPLNL